MKKLRIAFISDAVFPWHVGGLEAVELAEARELARNKDYEVTFFCMRWPGMQGGGSFVKDGITYRPMVGTNLGKFYRHRRRSIRTSVWFSLSMLRLARYRFDFIYANMFPILHVPILKLYSKLTRAELILDVVEVWEKKYWTTYLGGFWGALAYTYASYFLDSANAFVANSTATANGLAREGIGHNRIEVFAPILDDKMLRGVKRGAGRQKRILYYGRLIKEKRLDRWLEVVRKVHMADPSVKALIIGSGPEEKRIRHMIASMRLGRVVEMRPFYEDRERLFKDVAASSVFLLMSEREGLSVSTLESLSLGVPVVLPRYSPIPDEVKEMCVVADEADLPARILGILKSGKPDTFIAHSNRLERFYASRVGPFFSGLFRKTWTAYGRRDKLDEFGSILR